MAKLKMNGKTEEVKDGESITLAAEKLGVTFGCYAGVCGSCKIDILNGSENLTELTDEEKAMDMSPKKRLACQCGIKHGDAEINPSD